MIEFTLPRGKRTRINCNRTHLVAVDPGLHGCGIALFSPDGSLETAGYIAAAGEGPEGMINGILRSVILEAPEVLVIERPQVYVRSRSRARPADLVTLALVAGGVAGVLQADRTRFVEPHEWKGTVDPDVFTARLEARWRGLGRIAPFLPSPSLAHNVWDAIGLGAWATAQRGRQIIGEPGPRQAWSGLCPAGKHGLDFAGQPCDRCKAQPVIRRGSVLPTQ